MYVWCIFEHLKTDYVGNVDKGSIDNLVHEICKQISHIQMQEPNRRGVRQVTYTPKELYGKYISTAASLPNNADVWSVTL